MKDVLQEIVANKRSEMELLRGRKPSLRQALLDSPTGIIAEFKRRSPSRGWIKEEGRAELIPLSYQQAGAAALSILADNRFFGGAPQFITAARNSGVTLPILYKEFVIDELQIYQAALAGASAVLLIAACLTKQQVSSLMTVAHGLGLEVLLEIHSESELDYVDLQPDLCGVNNRNLDTFVTSVDNSFRLAERLPADIVKVSESGISDPRTISLLRQAGFKGFLIGATFMRTADPGAALADFIAQI